MAVSPRESSRAIVVPSEMVRLPESSWQLLPLSEPSIKLITIGLVLFDGLLATSLFVLSYWLRYQGHPLFVAAQHPYLPFFPYSFHPEFGPYLSVLYFVPLIQIAGFGYRGLYRVRGEFSFSDDFINIFKAHSVGALLVTVSAFFCRGGYTYSAFSYSRIVFVTYFVLGLVVFIGYRAALRVLQTFYRRRHRNVIPILILGGNEVAEMCINEIAHDPRLGRRVVGLVTADGRAPQVESLRGWPTLGRYDEMHRFIRLHRITEVLITDPTIAPELLFETMVKCGRGTRINFRIVPNLLNCIPRKTYVEQLGSVPMVRLFEEPLSTSARLLKRAVDVCVSSAMLVVTAPLWLLIAAAIKLEARRRGTDGTVFYKQERVGMDGHVFLLHKFRSMVGGDATDDLDEAHRTFMQRLIRTGEAQHADGRQAFYKFTDEQRLTRVGRWLRWTSLDELPQIFNVFKGEMSLVGPRPPLHYEVECYESWHRKRLDVKPGLTGLWQVSGRYHVSFEQMVQLDIFYIENWSLWLDLKIILKTLPALFMRERLRPAKPE